MDTVCRDKNRFLMKNDAQIFSDLIHGFLRLIDKGKNDRFLFGIFSVIMDIAAIDNIEGKRDPETAADILQSRDVPSGFEFLLLRL